jgi:large subunit ribosomal protein L36
MGRVACDGMAGAMQKEMGRNAVTGVKEQVRGMKVRSSVKKLCEGCKVCLLFFLRLLVARKSWSVEDGRLENVEDGMGIGEKDVGGGGGKMEMRGAKAYWG